MYQKSLKKALKYIAFINPPGRLDHPPIDCFAHPVQQSEVC